MENFSDKISEKIGRHFMFIVALTPPRPFYVIMWKNGAERAGHRWHYGAFARHAG